MCAIFSWISGWVSEIANGPIVLLTELGRVFPPQPNEPALPAVHLRGLFCQSRSSSKIYSHAAISVVTLL